MHRIEYDPERQIGRVELWDNGVCIASWVAHSEAEMLQIFKDFGITPDLPKGLKFRLDANNVVDGTTIDSSDQKGG